MKVLVVKATEGALQLERSAWTQVWSAGLVDGCGEGETILEHPLVFGLSTGEMEILPSQQLHAVPATCVL